MTRHLLPTLLLATLPACLFLEGENPGQIDPDEDMTTPPADMSPDIPIDPGACEPMCPPDKQCSPDGTCTCDPSLYKPSVQGQPCQPSCDGTMAPECPPTQVCDDSGEVTECVCPEGTRDVDGVCQTTCEGDGACGENEVCDDADGMPTCSCKEGFQDNDDDGTCEPDCPIPGMDCGDDRVCSAESGVAQCECLPGFQDDDGDGSCKKGCEHPELKDCEAPFGCEVFDGEDATCVEAPKNCQEAALLFGSNDDLELPTFLFLDNDPTQGPVPVICSRKSANGSWAAYIFELEPDESFSVDRASNLKTYYDRVRLDPETLTIDITDTTWARTEPLDGPPLTIPRMFTPPEAERFTLESGVPFATARSCALPTGQPPAPTETYDTISQAQFRPGYPLRFAQTSEFDAGGTFCPMGLRGGQRTLLDGGRVLRVSSEANKREPGCTLYGPAEYANKLSRRCMSTLTPGQAIPRTNFVLQLEYAPPP